ncbi:hypothetical protein [Sporomusa acidovorans]|uniref:Uncharacterized protein n=1 Tax=Sporomusa acidovorans (strain ATCC 49682 / DSM 3132 / Mol) TaxID=1123286 RepID=A0ABZ3J8A5_SPOA4|nr:hypothetical protein [Sporomusa acidovorans]OZC16017.1 hypothetical protein SPACI_43830 [Sporomusa acidovorans DSM 3132]SDD89603.1 ATP-binding sugar transporter [Sporomusa acidovorans]
MNLKDVMATDINDVFLDHDEFATYHDINGKQILCVIDEDISKQRNNRQSDTYDGLYQRELTLFVSEVDIGYRPERDQKMTVDGEWYKVLNCGAGGGMLEIDLGANRA